MAKDIYHYIVREALEKENWEITQDPYRLKTLKVKYEIDLGAEKIFAAEKENSHRSEIVFENFFFE